MDKGDYCVWRYSFSNGDTTFRVDISESHPLYRCTVCNDETMVNCSYYKPIRFLKLCRFPGDKWKG